MLMIGVMTYGISSGWFDNVPKNAEEYTYTVGGSPQVGYLYHDTLPLYVQDLTDTDYARYSCEALERGDSVFVRQVEYRQELPYDVRWSDENDPPLPELFYTVIDVKLAPLFDFCLQSTLHAEDLYGSEYRETDRAPTGRGGNATPIAAKNMTPGCSSTVSASWSSIRAASRPMPRKWL